MRAMVEIVASQVFDIRLPPRLRMLPARARGDGWREPSRMGFGVSIRYSGIVKVELLHHVSEGELPRPHASARVHLESTDGGSSWNAVSASLASLLVRALAIEPTRPRALYAGTKRGLCAAAIN